MKFKEYKFLRKNLLEKSRQENSLQEKAQPAPLVLAYLGDAAFSFYVKKRLVAVEGNKVHVLNDVSAKMVSAVMQAKALRSLTEYLTEKELDIVRRGRNTKSAVPKSASVSEYRSSTGFECLLGWLCWQDDLVRLEFLLDRSFLAINDLLLEEENGD